MRRNLFHRAWLESLELRRLLSLTVASPISDVSVPLGSGAGSVNVANTFTNTDLAGDTIVQMQTSQGTINLELYDSQAPITVQNFLSYVNSGQYDNTLFYRSVSGFVVQTGTDYPVDGSGNPINGSTPADTDVININTLNNAPTIQNEYSDSRPNVQGTIAMAKVSGNPNSASTEWFINLADNSSNLDNQNGGFTVFGQVLDNSSMTTAQTIGNLKTLADYGGSGQYSALPLANYNYGDIEAANLVLVPTVSVIPAITYSASSSNSAVVNPTLNGNNLALAYGQSGMAQVTVTATDVLGNSITDVFNVNVQQGLSVSNNGSSLINAQSTPINFGVVALNGSAQQTLTITNSGDQALALSSFNVPGGFAIIGTPPSSIAAGSSVNLVLAVDTSSAGSKSGTFSFATSDAGAPTFSVPLSARVDYSATLGNAGATKGKAFTYTDADGTLTTITLKGPGTLTPYFSSNTPITQSAGKKGTNFAGSDLLLDNLIVDSTTAKSSLTITSQGGNGSTTVGGLAATGAINTITAKGVVFTGAISFTSAKSITAGSASNASISGQSLATLSLAGNSNLTLALSGGLGAVTAKGSLAGTWTSAALGKLSASSLGNFNLTSGGTVASIVVKGAINNSNLFVGGVKTLSAASMNEDKLQASYTGSFPPAGGSLAATSTITSLKDKGAFANTDIVAGTLGSISLGAITTNNNGALFGLAGDSLKSLSAKANGGSIKLAKITPTNAAAAIAALGSLGNFQIAIV